jgi:hypothetical protein
LPEAHGCTGEAASIPSRAARQWLPKRAEAQSADEVVWVRAVAARLQSPDAEWRGWAADVLRAVGQQARGVKPDFITPVSGEHLKFEDATDVLRRLARNCLATIRRADPDKEPNCEPLGCQHQAVP